MASFLKTCWDEIQAQRDRWIFWAPVPAALGIAFYFSLRTEPPLYLGGMALSVFIVLSGAFYRNKKFFPLWVCVLLALTGFTAAQVRTWSVTAPLLAKKTYPATVQGRIFSVDPLPRGYRIVLENLTVVGGHIWQSPLPEKVRVKLKGNDPAVPVAGDIVRVKVVLTPVSPPVLPGAFDFQRYGFFNGLGATGYAMGDMQTIKPHEKLFFFEKLRQDIRARIYADVANKDQAALLTAFMVGDSHGIPKKIWDVSRKSGIAHLIAISGSHFLMIAGFPFFIIRALLAAIPFIALRWPVKQIAALFAIAISVFYMLLIGSPIPAQRAVISVCIIMLAVMLGRDPLTQRLAAFSALLILLVEPESLVGASFQLSFAAIVALIAFYESTREWWREKFAEPNILRRGCFLLIGCFMTTLVASAATGPFSLYHFSRTPFVAGLAANMVAVPLSSFITFPAGLLGCLLMPLGLEKPFLWMSEKSLEIIMAVAKTVSTWSVGVLHLDAWPFYLLGVIAFGGLWLCFWQGRVRWLGILPLLFAAILIPRAAHPDVLISNDGRLAAVRAADGKLWFSSYRVERFVRGEWTRREASAGTTKDATGVIDCTAANCLYRVQGRTVAFLRDAAVFPAACQSADIVVSTKSLDLCPHENSTKLIDKWALRRTGAMAIYFQKDGAIHIESVNGARGKRPWTDAHARWKRAKI